MSRLIGREKELKVLEMAKESGGSQFIAVYGRRRVGKTFLIREAFQQDFAFYLTGVANVKSSTEFIQFSQSITRILAGWIYFYPGKLVCSIQATGRLVIKKS